MSSHASKLRWAGAAVLGALLVGSGVAAAVAGSDKGSADSTDTTVSSAPSDVTSTTSAGSSVPTTVTTQAEAPDSGSAGDSAPTTVGGRYWGDECGESPMNHGQYVSGQPHGGSARSEAAQSPCGMPLSAVGNVSSSDAEPDATDTGDPPSDPGGGNGRGRGH